MENAVYPRMAHEVQIQVEQASVTLNSGGNSSMIANDAADECCKNIKGSVSELTFACTWTGCEQLNGPALRKGCILNLIVLMPEPDFLAP